MPCIAPRSGSSRSSASRVEVETPNPRAQIGGIAEKLDGRRLLSVEAVGKNLLFRFEGGSVLRSHLRMNGRWTLVPRGAEVRGRPWLVLRGSKVEARSGTGRCSSFTRAASPGLGPDILERPPRLDEMAARIRRGDEGRAVGDAILDQRLSPGSGTNGRLRRSGRRMSLPGGRSPSSRTTAALRSSTPPPG
jgi:endonuclease-8